MRVGSAVRRSRCSEGVAGGKRAQCPPLLPLCLPDARLLVGLFSVGVFLAGASGQLAATWDGFGTARCIPWPRRVIERRTMTEAMALRRPWRRRKARAGAQRWGRGNGHVLCEWHDLPARCRATRQCSAWSLGASARHEHGEVMASRDRKEALSLHLFLASTSSSPLDLHQDMRECGVMRRSGCPPAGKVRAVPHRVIAACSGCQRSREVRPSFARAWPGP